MFKHPSNKNFTLEGPKIIDRLLLCEKCKSTMKLLLTLFPSVCCVAQKESHQE